MGPATGPYGMLYDGDIMGGEIIWTGSTKLSTRAAQFISARSVVCTTPIYRPRNNAMSGAGNTTAAI